MPPNCMQRFKNLAKTPVVEDALPPEKVAQNLTQLSRLRFLRFVGK